MEPILPSSVPVVAAVSASEMFELTKVFCDTEVEVGNSFDEEVGIFE